MSPVPPPKQPAGNVQTEYICRLRELKKEYDDLERTEEKLLGMLETVRREEGYLVKALNDVHWPGCCNDGTKYNNINNNNTFQTIDQGSSKKQSQYSKELQTKKPPPPIAVQKDSTAATAIDSGTATRPRRKRRPVRPVEQTSNKNTVRHLEANRRAQRREERILARQRLENALFAEDDDDESTSSSSS
eukprot:CAMPEP_0116083180 /NCGR_PEP_ID=MMETSP0327-20121206/3129_1 /TAXON_ID=44447 /ORGANISM="Pseudo-nitzschia delicatissima, Strain B596" /LENGTH=188 /DNA_ID=CAMNT_0003574037 /DNA_START=68 /DNA_END=635 /DNA_ORIENTATION=-